MIVITGAAGFIASRLAQFLNLQGRNDLILVDDFSEKRKLFNHESLNCYLKIHRDEFAEWFLENAEQVEFVFHLGARTDTTEFNFRILDSLNLAYSKVLWEICTIKQIPFLYASSAATYGIGENDFDDNEMHIPLLKPLNPYGVSKQLFDLWVLEQKDQPPFWCGLKFFNVYGFGENHKGRMASVILHAFNQIKETGNIKLFKSHNRAFKDGEQLRDFIYVNDVIRICYQFFMTQKKSGIFNVGTGFARTFNDLAKAVFKAMNQPENIEYIPIPEDIRDKYQYYTCAKMDKLNSLNLVPEFTKLEDGIREYVHQLQQTTLEK